MDEHLVAVRVDTGSVAAQDHGQPVGRQTHTTQRPDVVVVEGAGLEVDDDPAVTRLGVRTLPHLETGQRVVCGL